MIKDVVVADAGPLIALGKCGRLDLLTQLFHEIHIPQKVFDEATAGRQSHETALIRSFINQSCILRKDRDDELLRHLASRLDAGESQAISWAHSLGSAVLMDEKRGRLIARAHGVPVIGLLGVLLLSKESGHLVAVKPLIQHLLKHQYLLSDALVATVLQRAGEN